MGFAKKLIDWFHTKYNISINHTSLDESADFTYCLAILFKLASQDGDTDPAETAKILEFIKPESRDRMGEALKVMHAGYEKAGQMDTNELFKFINSGFSLQQKKELLEMLYLVLRADDQQKDSEHAFVQKFAAATGISEDDHAEAYKKALEKRKSSA